MYQPSTGYDQGQVLLINAAAGSANVKPATSYVGASGNTTNANIPNYKSVYIWERTA